MKERKVKFFGKGWGIPKQDRPPEYWVSMEMDNTIDSIEAKEEYTVVFKLKRVEAPVISIAHSTVTWPAVKAVKNFNLHPNGSVRFKSVWLEN